MRIKPASSTGRSRAWTLVAGAGLLGMVGGCTNRSFFDPSVDSASRWGRTPASVPILKNLAAIEEDQGDIVEYSDPVAGDLKPEAIRYRIGQGDAVQVTVYDLIQTGSAEKYDVEVDSRGYIEIPQLGRILVGGKTAEDATQAVEEAMSGLVKIKPLASVVVTQQRQQTFNIVGGVEHPGPYFIPRANYRLLEAITAGGRFDESIDEVYVIRQVALSDEVMGGDQPASTTPKANSTPSTPTTPQGKKLIDIIDELAPKPGEAEKNDKGGGHPGAMGVGRSQPAGKPRAPVVNLPDEPGQAAPTAPEPAPASTTDGRWVFLNGKWVQLAPGSAPKTAAPAGDGLPSPTDDMITQRIIRVPVKDLLAGKQSVNIVIRPGDVLRVPVVPNGNVYMAGQVQRPGVYGLPSTGGGLTLTRAITAAGGLSSIAIAQRVDLTRMTGKDRQSTIMLNLAAINNGEQPDIWLKPNDHINVGTNFWALPLAVFRNGFRASYGFGFVLDRNIATDIFGAQRVSQ